jgi:hypothetical protein
MITKEMCDELKQFIDARYAQQLADFDGMLDSKLDDRLDHIFDSKLAPIKQQLDDLALYLRDYIEAARSKNPSI